MVAHYSEAKNKQTVKHCVRNIFHRRWIVFNYTAYLPLQSSEHFDDFKKPKLQQMCHKSSIQIYQIQTVYVQQLQNCKHGKWYKVAMDITPSPVKIYEMLLDESDLYIGALAKIKRN